MAGDGGGAGGPEDLRQRCGLRGDGSGGLEGDHEKANSEAKQQADAGLGKDEPRQRHLMGKHGNQAGRDRGGDDGGQPERKAELHAHRHRGLTEAGKERDERRDPKKHEGV